MQKRLLTIFIMTAWIGASEFIRNQIVFSSFWTDHYKSLGLVFPSKPLNGAVWGLWSLAFATLIYVLSKKYSFKELAALTWVMGFVLMWLVIGNLGVLPSKLLIPAVPLSMLEAVGAAYIAKKYS